MSLVRTSSLLLISIFTATGYHIDPGCIINQFSQVQSVVKNCQKIVISNLEVPPGEQLLLDLQNDTQLTFEGLTRFGVAYWPGHLVLVRGHHVKVEGAPGK